jgi:trk system potassium uptake protein TrkH
MIFVVGWVTLVALEPDSTWIEAHHPARDKLIDCASAVAATLNGVGPGLGIVGEAENYGHFHAASKFVLTWIMLLGRLEIFVLLALLVPRFWRR